MTVLKMTDLDLKGKRVLIREDLNAVSYTHLDVYKRQARPWTRHAGGPA